MRKNAIVSSLHGLVLILSLGACATQTAPLAQREPSPPGRVVVYQSNYNEGRSISYSPAEAITMVTPAAVVTRNTVGTGLVILSAFIGGNRPLTSTKEVMIGSAIEDENKKTIKNPFLDNYAATLKTSVDAWLNKNEEYKKKVYEKPMVISNGHARLIYEGLTGADAENYRLHVSMTVFKVKERNTSGASSQAVSCDYQTPSPKSELEWKKGNYQMIRDELVAAQNSCTDRVLASLPLLLAQ